jgi:hypothetical protein
MKTLNLSALMALLLIGFAKNSSAQTQGTGLYLTFNDFLAHKISYNTQTAGTKVTLNQFLDQKNVTVVSNGKKESIAKAEIFGYHSDGNDYRFFNNTAYQIIDTCGFYIYSYDRLVQQGKSPKPTRVYYFSTKPTSAVQQLTPENIAVAFPKNYKFRNMVDIAYHANLKLDAYDNASEQYKIKELYAESLK